MNALGSTQMVTDGTGTVTMDQVRYPWGGTWLHSGPLYDEHFAGMGEYSADSNAYPTEFRQYKPSLGRWLSPDPLGGDISNPQSLNRYAYGLNNPTTLKDPLGLCANGEQPCDSWQPHTNDIETGEDIRFVGCEGGTGPCFFADGMAVGGMQALAMLYQGTGGSIGLAYAAAMQEAASVSLSLTPYGTESTDLVFPGSDGPLSDTYLIGTEEILYYGSSEVTYGDSTGASWLLFGQQGSPGGGGVTPGHVTVVTKPGSTPTPQSPQPKPQQPNPRVEQWGRNASDLCQVESIGYGIFSLYTLEQPELSVPSAVLSLGFGVADHYGVCAAVGRWIGGL